MFKRWHWHVAAEWVTLTCSSSDTPWVSDTNPLYTWVLKLTSSVNRKCGLNFGARGQVFYRDRTWHVPCERAEPPIPAFSTRHFTLVCHIQTRKDKSPHSPLTCRTVALALLCPLSTCPGVLQVWGECVSAFKHHWNWIQAECEVWFEPGTQPLTVPFSIKGAVRSAGSEQQPITELDSSNRKLLYDVRAWAVATLFTLHLVCVGKTTFESIKVTSVAPPTLF